MQAARRNRNVVGSRIRKPQPGRGAELDAEAQPISEVEHAEGYFRTRRDRRSLYAPLGFDGRDRAIGAILALCHFACARGLTQTNALSLSSAVPSRFLFFSGTLTDTDTLCFSVSSFAADVVACRSCQPECAARSGDVAEWKGPMRRE